MRAVILAGGEGRRLRPYTTVLPKPLMPVGDRPILERVISQLREAGVDRVTMAVGYLAPLLQAYFGDGSRFGLPIDYSLEQVPLGTAGPLSLIDPPAEDFLVMNGDLLTDLDFGDLVAAHRASGATATLAVFQKEVQISLGIVEVDETNAIVGYTEKPTLSYAVSSGIYCFSPDILEMIPADARLDLPDLVKALVLEGRKVQAYPFEGMWLDIGRPEDYEEAQSVFAE